MARKTGGICIVALLSALVALAAPLAATAAPAASKTVGSKSSAFVPDSLRAAAEADPSATFSVIVQGAESKSTDAVATDLADEGAGKGIKHRFATIAGVSAEVTGKQLLKLAGRKNILAITEDAAVTLADNDYYNGGAWPYIVELDNFWPGKTNKLAVGAAPTIAIVDSGVAASRADFGDRVVKQVTLTSLVPNAPGDGRGHGTFVASIAAGSATGRAGASPMSKIVSLDVTDDNGMAMTSDVVAAADWILRNKDEYGIRVANFSLHSARAGSFRYDPLDRAVERLWFSGVVVVAAAGNYAVDGQASGVRFAPANDPFVITVGATNPTDLTPAPWSAFGYTRDGFRKPEVSAPGRALVGAVPLGATMALQRPDRVVAPGYMRMSGTSFAAPVVSGAAAVLLARNPQWTPDQVKGALMVAARRISGSYGTWANGVGMIDAKNAVSLVVPPPNPNRALEPFVVADPAGGPFPVFDAASWSDVARTNASWDAASWSDASWSDASWDAASWSDASWSDASWSDASWDAGSVADSIWVP